MVTISGAGTNMRGLSDVFRVQTSMHCEYIVGIFYHCFDITRIYSFDKTTKRLNDS